MNLESEIKCYIRINKVLKESIYRWNSVLLGYRPLLEVVNAKCPLLKREDCPTNLCPVYKKDQCIEGGLYSGISKSIETRRLDKYQTLDQTKTPIVSYRINTMIIFLKNCLQDNESLCCLSLEKFLEEGGILR